MTDKTREPSKLPWHADGPDGEPKTEIFDATGHLVGWCDGFDTTLEQDETNVGFILQAVNRMTPKAPNNPYIDRAGHYADYKCPACRNRLRSGMGSSNRGRDNFCQKCGQKIDWSHETPANRRMMG